MMSCSLAAKRPEETLAQDGAQLVDIAPTAMNHRRPTVLKDKQH